MKKLIFINLLFFITGYKALFAEEAKTILNIWLIEQKGKRELFSKLTEGFENSCNCQLKPTFYPLKSLLIRLDAIIRLKDQATNESKPDIIEVPSRFFNFYSSKYYFKEILPEDLKQNTFLNQNFLDSDIGMVLSQKHLNEKSLERSYSPFSTVLQADKKNSRYTIHGVPFLFSAKPLLINSSLIRKINNVSENLKNKEKLDEFFFETWEKIALNHDTAKRLIERYYSDQLAKRGIQTSDSQKNFGKLLLENKIPILTLLDLNQIFLGDDDLFWFFPIFYNYGVKLISDTGKFTFNQPDNLDNLLRAVYHILQIAKLNTEKSRYVKGEITTQKNLFLEDKALAILTNDLSVYSKNNWKPDFYSFLPPRGLSKDNLIRNYLFMDGSNFALISNDKYKTGLALMNQIYNDKTDLNKVLELTGKCLATTLNPKIKKEPGLNDFVNLVIRNGRYLGQQSNWPSVEVAFETEMVKLMRQTLDLDLNNQDLKDFVKNSLNKIEQNLKGLKYENK